MQRLVRTSGILALSIALSGTGASAAAHHGISTPRAVGDQVVLYYNASPGFTTFINVGNDGGSELTLSLLFYGPTFDAPLAKTITLPAKGVTTIDVGALRDSGLPAQFGIMFATAVDASATPISTGALTGNFTVADVVTGSGWGAAGAARSAVDRDGGSVPAGTQIDGKPTTLTPFAPDGLSLAAYYDPASLPPVTYDPVSYAPLAGSGNQLIFISFNDTYTPQFGATAAGASWWSTMTRANGTSLSEGTAHFEGVMISDIKTFSGPPGNGAGGSLRFITEEVHFGLPSLPSSRLIYFTQSLGTFGTGYLLPTIDVAE